MRRQRLLGLRLVAIFLFGCVLLNYPVLSLFDRPGQFLGLPLLYAYLFAAWAVLIGLMALIAESGSN